MTFPNNHNNTMTITPFFSIIIPVYNTAPFLEECLSSVANQTFTNWECICVNDGSTDNSGSILDDYSIRDSRFKIIHKENEGVSVARNRALDIVKGEYIAFVDSDDYVCNHWLENIYK